MNSLSASLILFLKFALNSASMSNGIAYKAALSIENHGLPKVLPNFIKAEIMKTFPGVDENTLLLDFLSNTTYVHTLFAIQLHMCHFDVVATYHEKKLNELQKSNHRSKRSLFSNFTNLFPKDFWVTDVHKGYYYYLKHLDPWRWWHEACDFIEIKSSLPPLYYVAKYFPNEIRFLKDNDYKEEYYKNLTWPPGLDPLWTGDPNKTTNLFTELTESSSSESIEWEPYSGESTTTSKIPNHEGLFAWI